MNMRHIADYPITVKPLSEEDGGGFLISFPDLPGCMSDGETIEGAMANAEDALNCWRQAQNRSKRQCNCNISPTGKIIPQPNSAKK